VQSYSAYTLGLAALNERHLQSKDSPDNILFRIEPIDGRLPALEDGLSWPALANNYAVTEVQNNFAYLRKRASPHEDFSVTELSIELHSLDEEVYLPKAREPLFAEIDITPTLVGRFISLLFKPPQLSIELHLDNGTIRNYRLISSISRAGFVISPLIENTKEFVFLTESDSGHLANKVVNAFEISSSGRRSIFWNSRYSVKLSTISVKRDPLMRESDLIDYGHVPAAMPETIASETTMHHSHVR
jgi:hypothetical protein